jgi:uncharacterized protein
VPDCQNDAAVVESQIGRPPRTPWRVAVRCKYGYPAVIASPGLLDDGTRFPTALWLTCPWVGEAAAAEESAGATAQWSERASTDPALAQALRNADEQVRARRTAESGGEDPCPSVGIAGQRDPLGVKCLHAHAAAALAGIDDPIGVAVLERCGRDCPDGRCARFDVSEREG